MTRSAHNVDRQRTEQAHFLDSRSYWTNAGHCYLFGDDARQRRADVYESARGHCQGCETPHFVGWSEGHLHHVKGGNTDDRCWCWHNLAWVCPEYHRLAHVRVLRGKNG